MAYNDRLVIGVEISIKSSIDNDPSIGLYDGVLRFTESSSTINGKPALQGVLSKKWVSSISKSVDIRRVGNYATLNNITLNISNNFGLIEELKTLDLSISSEKVTIIYDYDYFGGSLSGKFYTGIVTSVDPQFDLMTIKTESLSKGYESPASYLIPDTDIYKPVFIGPANSDNTEFIEKAKGVYVDNGSEDILHPSFEDLLIWKVNESFYDHLRVSCVNKSLTAFQMITYLELLENSEIPVYVEVINGSGEGEIFPFNPNGSNQVDGSPSSIVTYLGSFVQGILVAGTQNKTVDGIIGEEYEKYDTLVDSSLDGYEYSLVKFITLDKFVQMDGFPNTRYGYAGESFIYDEDAGFLEAPEYGGGFTNVKDKMIQSNEKGERDISLGTFDTDTVPVSLKWAEPDDIEGLVVDDFPAELQPFFVFEDSLHKGNSVWSEESGGTFIVDTDPEASLSLIIDKDVSTNYNARNYSIGNDNITKSSCLFKIGMPEFSKKPSSLYFTSSIILEATNSSSTRVGVGKYIALIVNTFRGWEVVDYKYIDDMSNTDGNDPSAPGGSNYFVRNLYPPNAGNPIDISDIRKNYDYVTPNLTDKLMNSDMLTRKDSLIFDVEDYIFDNQSSFFLAVGAIGTGFVTMGNIDLTIEEISFSGQYEIQASKTSFDYVGRAFDGGFITRDQPNDYGNLFYDHICRLQNLSVHGINKPNNGWGSEYPSVLSWSDYVDSSVNYGGTNNPELAPNAKIEGQKLTYNEMNTKAMKKELSKLMWAMGTISDNGIEKIFPMIPAITADDGFLVQYFDIKDSIKFSKTLFVDIFCQGTIQYNYDENSKTYRNSISISNVDNPVYSETFVAGVSDPVVANDLWALGHKLHETYKIINTLPDEIGQVKLIKDEAGALSYFQDLFAWQGVRYDEIQEGLVVDERYDATFKIGLDVYIKNSLGHGSKIRMDIPTITTGPTDYHKGIITNLSIDISDKPTVSITAAMRGNITPGGDITIIDTITEGEGFVDTITEDATNLDTITEGAE